MIWRHKISTIIPKRYAFYIGLHEIEELEIVGSDLHQKAEILISSQHSFTVQRFSDQPVLGKPFWSGNKLVADVTTKF